MTTRTAGRLPPMKAGEALKRRDGIDADQHFTEPPPRYTEEALIKRMEELGIGRPSTYAATLAVLEGPRTMCGSTKSRLIPEDKGRLVTAFLESFFNQWVDYDFTANLEEQLDRVSNHEIDWRQVLRDFWREFSAAIGGTKDLRTTEVLDNLNGLLGPLCVPRQGATAAIPATCPVVRQRPALAQARQVRRLHRLLELSRVQVHPHAERDRRRSGRRRRRRQTQGSGASAPTRRAAST